MTRKSAITGSHKSVIGQVPHAHHWRILNLARPWQSRTHLSLSKTHNQKRMSVPLGLIRYYCKILPNADGAAVLMELTKKGRPNNIIWTREYKCTFNILKKCMINAPVLQVADPSKPFILQTDVSDFGLGTVVSQPQNGEEHPAAFTSHQLTPKEVFSCREGMPMGTEFPHVLVHDAIHH